MIFLDNVCCRLVLMISNAYDSIWDALNEIYSESEFLTCIEGNIPRVGRAEKLKVQEAIPPFSLIEDTIQGRRPETLVKTA